HARSRPLPSPPCRRGTARGGGSGGLGGIATVVGKDGPVPFLSLFEGRVELLVYQHMWWDGAPHQGQCEGRALTAWHLQDATSLRTAGVSFAVLTTGEKEEAEPFLAFMGCTEPRHSERRTPHPIGGDM